MELFILKVSDNGIYFLIISETNLANICWSIFPINYWSNGWVWLFNVNKTFNSWGTRVQINIFPFCIFRDNHLTQIYIVPNFFLKLICRIGGFSVKIVVLKEGFDFGIVIWYIITIEFPLSAFVIMALFFWVLWSDCFFPLLVFIVCKFSVFCCLNKHSRLCVLFDIVMNPAVVLVT
jgi:hypothetical protein